MASQLRQMTLLQRCFLNHMKNTRSNIVRQISTSKKDTSATACEQPTADKNWVSYGYDYTDQKEDTSAHHASYFFSVTLCLVFGGFYMAYSPDIHLRDWSQREAFIELRRREKAGLPLIDPNYVPVSQVTLPSESELCDVEIII